MVLSVVAVGGIGTTGAADGSTTPVDEAAEDVTSATDVDEHSRADSRSNDTTDAGETADVEIAKELRTKSDRAGTEDVLILLEGEFDVASDLDRAGAADRLRQQAERTQAPVVSELDRLDGVDVDADFWITNALSATIDLESGALDALAEIDGIEAVYRNHEITRPDPIQSDGGGLSPQDHGTHTYGLEQINVPEFWDEYGQGEGATVAIMDGGVAEDHPDIDATEAVAIDNDGNVIPDAVVPDYHGTHVASTATGGNASGTHIGVAPEADLYAADIFSEGGQVGSLIGAIEWAVENDADVLSGSVGFGGGGDPPLHQEPLIEPIRNANRMGTSVVSSAGNSGDGLVSGFGANFDAFSIGASDDGEAIAAFSSGGLIDKDRGQPDWPPSLYPDDLRPSQSYDDPPADWPQQWIKPDVSAPGASVFGADVPGSGGYGDGDYMEISGTSMAAPHVAGAIALLQSATDDHLDDEEIEAALAETATKPAGWNESDARWQIAGKDSRYGLGIIDVKAAADLLTGDGTATIDGTVTAADSDEPLSGVQLTTDDGLVTGTGENGTYSLEVAATDDVNLTADAFGYAPATRSVDIDAGDITIGTDDTAATDGTVPDYPLGDVDHDDEVGPSDVIAVQQHIVGLDPGQGNATFDENLADVDRDGEIGLADVILIQQHIVGLLDEPTLEVTDLDAPANATEGDVVTANATIENDAAFGAIGTADYVVDDRTHESTVVDVGGADTGENTSDVTFEVDVTWEAGDYDHGVATADDDETTPLTVEPEEGPDATADFELDETVAAAPVDEQPHFAEIGEAFNVTVDVANLEEYTVDLTEASDVDAAAVTVALDGEEIELGEPVDFNESVTGERTLTVEVNDSADEGETVELEHTFAGPGDDVDLTTGPSELTDEIEPAFFELSDFEGDSELVVEDGVTVDVSVNVTNTGQETATRDVDYLIDEDTGLPQLETLTLDPGETQTVEASIGGLEGAIEAGQTVEHGFVTEVNTRDFITGFPTDWDEEVFEEIALLEPGTDHFAVEAAADVETGPGNETTITADVANYGEENGTQTVELRADGDAVASREVTLDSVATESVTFEDVEAPDEEGAHRYDVVTENDTESMWVMVGIEPDAYDVTVVQHGDEYGEEAASMIESHVAPTFNVSVADAGNATDAIDDTDVFVFHDLPDDEIGETLVEAVENDHTTGGVYLDQWGEPGFPAYQWSDGITVRSSVTGEPTETSQGDALTGGAEPPVSIDIVEDHPIFDGVGGAGDSVVIHEGTYAEWTSFEGVDGDVLGEVSHAAASEGPAVSVDEDTGSVLVSSISPTLMIGQDAFTEDAAAILANSVQVAEDRRTFTGSIAGTVTDRDTDEPVGGVTVEAEDENGTVHTATTDEDGTYEIDGVEPGYYLVDATDTPDGYEPEEIVTVEIAETATADLEVVPQTAVVTGTVVDADGAPVEGAEVFDADDGEFAATTDQNGTYEIDSDAFERGDEVVLRAEADGYEPSTLTFLELGPGANEAVLELGSETESTVDRVADDPLERNGVDERSGAPAVVTG